MRFTALGSYHRSRLAHGPKRFSAVVSTLCEEQAVRSADAAGCGLNSGLGANDETPPPLPPLELVCRANAETLVLRTKAALQYAIFHFDLPRAEAM